MTKFYFFQKILLGGGFLLLCISLGLNYIFYKADVEHWIAYRQLMKIENTHSTILDDVTQFHAELVKGSYKFLKNNKRLELPVYTDVRFTERYKNAQKHKEAPIMGLMYGESDGFMFLELLEDAIKQGNVGKINYLKNYFDKNVYDVPFSHTLQAVHSIISIRLYEHTKEEKYRTHADRMYKYLLSQNTKYGILYVQGLTYSIVDVLGVVVPFLVEYSKTFNCSEAYKLALQQIEIYTKYGCDKETGMPAFAYTIKEPHVKIGRINWGRGVSWYIIGVSYINIESLSPKSQKTINKLNATLSKIWNNEHKFNHFICDPFEKRDLSAELPILYYLNKIGRINLSSKQILSYSQFMHNGIMYNGSTDNSGAIKYGIALGPQILSQTYMLRLTK